MLLINKIVMKKLNDLFVLGIMMFVSLGLFSCSQDEDAMNPFSPATRTVQLCTTKVQANLILVNYLELTDETYVLNISAEEAEQLGVPFELYENALSEIATTNEFVKKTKKDPSVEIELTDPQKALKSRNADNFPVPYAAPSGTLTTNGQEEVMSGYIWAPSGTKGIQFLCRANAAITPIYNCKTYSSGSWQTKSAVGAIGTNTTIKVPLYVSNDNIRVAFSTSDSNGGTATYEGYN